jgi:alpha-L-arabinofuranosidase
MKINLILTIWYAGMIMSYSQTNAPKITIEVSNPGALVADICRGQQLEEFNHQFEGGLYAQLISNPSFEEIDNKFNSVPAANWALVKSGSSDGNLSGQTASETKMLNSYQNHCIKLEVASVASGSVGIANGGYWGIKLENNTKYKVSFWARKGLHYNGRIYASLESDDGTVYARSADFKPTSDWQHFTCELSTSGISKVSGSNRFVLYASATGDVDFDVVTVMPPTWKNRPNGLRPDLADRLNALKFKYIQFPGGCTAESASMDKCWNWKNSIGPLEERSGSTRNRWWYKNDLYFGLDEYFQLCEDLGAEPVYVTSAGIDERPNSPAWYALCPLDKMKPIIDDILDLLQYCNGSTSTVWGARRAENGHPEPYNLRYIEIGNENGRKETENDYSLRYSMIYGYIKAAWPEVKVMYNGSRGIDEYSDPLGNPVDFVDEHFYEKDLSVLYHKYDRINPACKKICVAEYASNSLSDSKRETGNFGDALGDAVFMLGCEKNSERVWWTGYGNYAGFVGHFEFGPCIVWNDAVSNYVTPSYYMQKILFSDNQGSFILPFTQKTANCYWSVSLDVGSGRKDVLIKVVNNKEEPETVNIILTGGEKVDAEGHYTTMTGTPDAENSLADPDRIVPSYGTFTAGSSFNYTFRANSINILRVKLSKH